MSTENKEPFPLFPITKEEREKLLEVAEWYVRFPNSDAPICHRLCTSSLRILRFKITEVIDSCNFYTEYLESIGRYDLAATPAKSRLHWLRLLINQPTIEDTEEKQQDEHET
jgi:hypothetical protein